MKKFLVALHLLFLPYSGLLSQEFSGSYFIRDYDELIFLNLEQDDNGRVTGTMSSEGIEYNITGKKQGKKLTGLLEAEGESLKLSAQFINNDLHLTLSDPEAEPGEYDEYAETWVFKEQTETTTMKQNRNTTVVINGISLTDEQISEIEQTYSVKPLPGNYWYDPYSGLYGVEGYQAYGFMLAGHDYGELDSRASNGDSGVFVNGRELPQVEWVIWSQLLGYIIQPGRYWLDENGNAGYEGNPLPTENLYLAAQRNYYGGGGGDNIWSSRFGAGNYDSNNQRGYVSVPGHGPIGYGF
jgi:hypothetical protein